MHEAKDAEELRTEQRRREVTEDERARTAPDEQEAVQHERRAEKARYLRQKLDQRVASERDDDER